MKVTENDVRPAGRDDECFYCHVKLGGEHKFECVSVTRKVKVRAVVEYVVDVPQSWDVQMIEFHRNGSGWCAGNLIDELTAVDERSGCLCDITRFEYVGECDDMDPDDE